MASSIKLSVNFKSLLEDIKDAGGDIEIAARKVAEECAKTMHDELVSECNVSAVPSSVSGEIQHSVTATAGGNVYEIEAGWKMGEYDANNPSAGYKAVFLNYGTARRSTRKEHVHHQVGGQWKTLGTDRGAVTARGFIGRAKKSANKKIKKVQKNALDAMLKELT